MIGLALAIALAVGTAPAAPIQRSCSTWHVTGYVAGEGRDTTADGTSVWTDEPIAAANSLPFDTYVTVRGLGTYRIADRGGGLGPRDLDIRVWSRAQAFSITGEYTVCLS